MDYQSGLTEEHHQDPNTATHSTAHYPQLPRLVWRLVFLCLRIHHLAPDERQSLHAAAQIALILWSEVCAQCLCHSIPLGRGTKIRLRVSKCVFY